LRDTCPPATDSVCPKLCPSTVGPRPAGRPNSRYGTDRTRSVSCAPSFSSPRARVAPTFRFPASIPFLKCGNSYGAIRAKRRWSASTRATWPTSSVRTPGVTYTIRPSSRLVLPGSSRIAPAATSRCRRSRVSTSLGMRQPARTRGSRPPGGPRAAARREPSPAKARWRSPPRKGPGSARGAHTRGDRQRRPSPSASSAARRSSSSCISSPRSWRG